MICFFSATGMQPHKTHQMHASFLATFHDQRQEYKVINERIRLADLQDRIMTADQAALLFQPGMTVGMSGFTKAGDSKAMPEALARRSRQQPLHLTLITGASLGNDSDGIMADAGVLAKRMPFQVDTVMRRQINTGDLLFTDQHLSETVEMLRSGYLGNMDIAIIEACAITEDGNL